MAGAGPPLCTEEPELSNACLEMSRRRGDMVRSFVISLELLFLSGGRSIRTKREVKCNTAIHAGRVCLQASLG